MEKIYTEQEIKNWFKSMMKEYQHCLMGHHLQSVYDEMFDPFWKENNLQTFVEKNADKKNNLVYNEFIESKKINLCFIDNCIFYGK